MRLDDYLHEKRKNYECFARKIGMTSQTVRTAVKGQQVSFRTAKKIVDATNCEVGFEDLLPEVYMKCVTEYLRKTRSKE